MSNICFMLSVGLDKTQTLRPRPGQSQGLSPWVTSHPFQTGASIRVGFALFKGTEKIRVTPKPLAPTLHFKHHLFRNVIFLLFTQPYTTAGLIFLLIFTSGKRGAHTTFGPHSDVLDGCSLFSSHQTLFEEWFMSRNLWKRLPHANVN